jgi:hypothetical protein
LHTEFLTDMLQTPPIVAENRTVMPPAKSQVNQSYTAECCVLSLSYSVLFNSVCVPLHAGSTSQLSIIKPAQKHRENTKTIQIQKTEY